MSNRRGRKGPEFLRHLQWVGEGQVKERCEDGRIDVSFPVTYQEELGNDGTWVRDEDDPDEFTLYPLSELPGSAPSPLAGATHFGPNNRDGRFLDRRSLIFYVVPK